MYYFKSILVFKVENGILICIDFCENFFLLNFKFEMFKVYKNKIDIYININIYSKYDNRQTENRTNKKYN